MSPPSLPNPTTGGTLAILNTPAASTSSPTSMSYNSMVTGNTQVELLNALASGATPLMFGRFGTELNGMIPAPGQHDILTLVAEGRLLYGRNMAMALANAIHLRAHLVPEQVPVLHLVLHELLSNAIEHGNLGLSSLRSQTVTEDDWFDAYQDKVHEKMASPLGRIPIRITCEREATTLVIAIEDRGMGFAFRKIMTMVQANELPTGRGLSLVHTMLGGKLEYTEGGRKVTFRLSLRERNESQMPNRSTIHEHARILIVDDHQLTSRIAKKAFMEAGFRHIELVNDSTLALETARNFKPDLIILDIIMKDLDGFEVFAQIKDEPILCETPVIFFSAVTEAEHRKRGYQMGAVDFVSKPIEPAELVARAETHVLGGVMLHKLQTMTAKLAEDIERARVFQQNLLPSPTQLETIATQHGLDITTTYQGCDTLAGDYWNILHLDATHIAFTLVDFTGHGVIAALNTVQFHTLLKAHAFNTNPVAMAKLLNHHLHQILTTGNFATCVYGVLNTATGHLTYAGCGAPNILLRTATGETSQLDCSGLPLGITPDLPVEPRTIRLMPGDSLIAYSDALIDSPHQHGARWEIDGLMAQVASLPAGLTSQQTVTTLLNRFYATVQLPVPDDLSILALMFLGNR